MVIPTNAASQLQDLASKVNYNDAQSFIKNENGVTKEVFGRYVQSAFSDVSSKDAEALFNRIDRNGSGGLREAEFKGFRATPMDSSLSGDKSGANSVSVSGSGNASDSASVRTSGVNATFGGYKKLTRVDGGTDTFNNVPQGYMVIAESHGRNAHSKVSANQLPKVQGAELVSFGGSHDKYIALYKVTDSTVKITGDGGSGQAMFINTKQKVSMNAKAADPSLGSETLKGPAQSNQLAIYAEDEGGKGSRDSFFGSNAIDKFGAGDDLIYLFGDKVSPNNNKGPSLNGAAGILTFS